MELEFEDNYLIYEGNKIQAVWFDLDDTLYTRSQPFIKACEDILAPQFQLDWEAFNKARIHYGNEVFEASQKGQMSMEEMYIYRTSNALKDFGKSVSKDTILELEQRYQYHQKHIELCPRAKRILDDLREHSIPMGIITNGPDDHQRVKLNALGISHWISEEYWVISGAIGITKPDPGIFHHAKEKMGIVGEHLLFIGDNYEVDILGARNAGWNAMLWK